MSSPSQEVVWPPQWQDLVPTVAQDWITGRVLMVAFMNREAFEATMARRRAVFYSRSRQCLWEKGETSGHTLLVQQVYLDCDQDAVLLRVAPQGPTCHTGATSCFFVPVGEGPTPATEVEATVLDALGHVLASRREAAPDSSYVARLFAGGSSVMGRKLMEEACEVLLAGLGEEDARLVAESADLWFHNLVLLQSRGIGPGPVLAELARRFGISGLEERARRAGG